MIENWNDLECSRTEKPGEGVFRTGGFISQETHPSDNLEMPQKQNRYHSKGDQCLTIFVWQLLQQHLNSVQPKN